MKILRNCTLIPELTEGYRGNKADILIDGKFIKKIEKPGFDFNIKNTEDFDLHGKTLMPGLFELHCHLGYTNKNVLSWIIKEGAERAFEIYKYAKAYLMAGTTTVRDVGGDYETVIATRDAINNDTVDGPRIFTSGKILTPTENGNSFFPTWYVEVDSPTEVRKACRIEFQKGADFIKYMGSGAMMNPGGVPGMTIVEEDELCEAVKIAKTKNSYVAVHCHGAESIKLAAKCGVRTIEHGSFIDEEGIELLKKCDSYIIPTLFVVKTLTDESADGAEFMKPKIEALIKKEIACLKKAYSAGLKIGWGTDVDVDSFVKNPGMEFILRKEWLDMKEIDILLQATKHSAEIINCDDKLGTVKEGKYADLIVVDGDPVKNIELMNTGIVHVFKEGKQYK